MSDAAKPPRAGGAAPSAGGDTASAGPKPCAACDGDAVACERCGGGNVYRMHAVWRCADCGYKTDCCGW